MGGDNSIMHEASVHGHCAECPDLKCIHQQTEETPSEYWCPAMEDEKDCFAYDEVFNYTTGE